MYNLPFFSSYISRKNYFPSLKLLLQNITPQSHTLYLLLYFLLFLKNTRNRHLHILTVSFHSSILSVSSFRVRFYYFFIILSKKTIPFVSSGNRLPSSPSFFKRLRLVSCCQLHGSSFRSRPCTYAAAQ